MPKQMPRDLCIRTEEVEPIAMSKRFFADAIASTTSVLSLEGNKKSYCIHTRLLEQWPEHSGGLFAEYRVEKTNRHELPMEDVELFDIFVTWLYCSTMRFSSGSSYSLMDIVKEWKSANNRTVNDCDGTLMQLHYFGKLYHIPNLQRDALDALHDWYTSSNMPSPQWSTLVDHYIAAPKASLLRQMLVDVFCRYHIANIDIMVEESTLLMEAGMEFQAAAFRRYSQVMSKVMGGSLDPMYDLNLCVYHEHANVQEREQCPRRSQKYDKSVYPGIV